MSELKEENRFKILVVDDNPRNIQVIGSILRESDYIVGYATGGEQALSLLHNNENYDLVLLDIEMPEMNGYEVCEALRSDPVNHEIPVIFLTAYSEVENIVKGFDAGAQDYIIKPFNSRELLARVDTHLQLKAKSDLIRKMNLDLEQVVEERTTELQRAYNELNEIDNLKTDFLYFISQEIRIPLNGITGTINLIKNQEYSSTIKDLVETLDISVSRLEDFTYKISFFNQLHQNKYPFKPSELKLKDLIQYSILELECLLTEKGIDIEIQSPANNYFILADRDLLFKAFGFILHNALKFSPFGSKVLIEISVHSDHVKCSFTDHGVGFSEETINMFSLPFQLGKMNGVKKPGMSLHIVKQIMLLHDGEIAIFNKENAGACVELTFKK